MIAKHTMAKLTLTLLLVAEMPPHASAEEVDRVVAVAAGRAITWSAILVEANAEAFLAGRPAVKLRLADAGALNQLRGFAERLADQRVLERARENSALASEVQQEGASGSTDDRATRSAAMWAEVAAAHGSPAELAAALREYGLDEASLRGRMLRQQQLFAFVDFSLRPQVKLAANQVVAFYQEEFVPQYLREQPAAEPPVLEEVRARIEEILTQREINRLMGPWQENLRKEYGFRWLPDSPSPGGGGAGGE